MTIICKVRSIVFVALVSFSLGMADRPSSATHLKNTQTSQGNDLDLESVFSSNIANGDVGLLSLAAEALSLELDLVSTERLTSNLASSPSWCLHYERWGLVATRRQYVNGRWTLPPDKTLRFGKRPHEQEVLMEIHLISMGASTSAFDLIDSAKSNNFPISRTVDPNRKESYVSEALAGYNGLTFFVREVSSDPASEVVQNALAYLANTVASFSTRQVSTKEPVGSEYPGLLVEKAKDGVYNVFANLNPGQKGTVQLRISDPSTGINVVGEYLDLDSSEIMGWSDDHSKVFLYNRGIVIDRVENNYKAGQEYDWILYFVPADGGSERVLDSIRMPLSVWQPNK